MYQYIYIYIYQYLCTSKGTSISIYINLNLFYLIYASIIEFKTEKPAATPPSSTPSGLVLCMCVRAFVGGGVYVRECMCGCMSACI